ncbi:hypothetical protein NAT51_19210 [Flavobacterium amniphilum]|uniref:hypothetical protein n=1 Tax=Flavobacterium amniphilum TaxID=1834035 RepID=UPI00202A7F46|nr:hypothetical protein [Flavobacterium amniphilum]MCL9807660.1 hypothetical protein [Flavobacterium amniphilum]
MKVKNSILLFLCVLFISSCGKSFDSQEEMTAFITDEDNGYQYKKTVNGVDYTLQYRPTDLLVKQELSDKYTDKQVEDLRKQYGKYIYFNLSMSKNNQELLNGLARDKERFGQMVNDLAFGMEEKVHLFTPKKDTLAMADFIYPRMYGMTDATTLMIVYPRDEKFMQEEYLNFTIEDLGLDTGEIKFKVKTSELKDEPQLRF